MMKQPLLLGILLLVVILPLGLCAKEALFVQLSDDQRVEYGVTSLRYQLKPKDLAKKLHFIVGLKSDTTIVKHLTADELNSEALSMAEGFLVKRLSPIEPFPNIFS